MEEGKNDSKTSRIGRETKILLLMAVLPCFGKQIEILPRNILLKLGLVRRYVRKNALTKETFSSFSSPIDKPNGQKHSLWETRNAKRQIDSPKVTHRSVAKPILDLDLN